MKFTIKIKSYVFTGTDYKSAYLSACKWLATNVIANKDFDDLTYGFKKLKEDNQIRLTLYISLDEKQASIDHCKICRETHSLFYVNQKFDCNKCREKAYRERLKQKIKISKGYYLERLKVKNDGKGN